MNYNVQLNATSEITTKTTTNPTIMTYEQENAKINAFIKENASETIA